MNTGDEKLKKDLIESEEAYYRGESKIPDELYDFKLRKLKLLDPNADSIVGHVRAEQRNFKLKHQFPMLSLDNAFNEEELLAFFKSHQKILCGGENRELEYFLEPKIDGVSISLFYREGKLIQAISRGDGVNGEDLSAQIREIEHIPKELNTPLTAFVRGEIYITSSEFRKVQEEEREKTFMNSRNYVSGTLRLKESKNISKKRLSLCAYQILELGRESFSTQGEVIEFLRNAGIPTHDKEKSLKSSDVSEILKFLLLSGDRRKSWELPTDGFVVKLNELKLHKLVGSTSKFPKWAIAYKYPSLIKETILEKIEVTVGRSGRITYIGKIKPIELNGSIINYLSLHNFENIKKLDLREGSRVLVYKSGEVIPQLLSRVKGSENDSLPHFKLITSCPCCHSQLVFKDEQKLQYCENEECERQKICQLLHFCSKAGVNIEGLSEQTITKLFKSGLISSILDIYSLKNRKEELYALQGLNMKEKSFNNLITSIERSKLAIPEKILSSFGIKHLGKENAKLLLRHFGSIEELFAKSTEELIAIEGIGEKCVKAIEDWKAEEKNLKLLKALSEIGFQLSLRVEGKRELTQGSHYLTGKIAVITGSFKLKREELQNLLSIRYGLKFKNSLSREVELLIVGENPSSKVSLGKERGLQFIELPELKRLLPEYSL